jgi:dTMP kinase
MKDYAIYFNKVVSNITKLQKYGNSKKNNLWIINSRKINHHINHIFDLSLSPHYNYYKKNKEELDLSVFNLPAEVKFYLNNIKGKKAAITTDERWIKNVANIEHYSNKELKSIIKDYKKNRIDFPRLFDYINKIKQQFIEKSVKHIFLYLEGEEISFNDFITPLSIFFKYSRKRLSYSGYLIVFEGVDGSGKSTQINMAYDHLKDTGRKVIKFREPSNSKWGKIIREKAKIKNSLTPKEQYELFLRDRKYDFNVNLLPYLKKGYIVLLDRYYHSTYSYQGERGINKKKILRENLRICSPPEITFILDITTNESWERISFREKEPLFENKKYLEKVRENYFDFWGRDIHFISADQNPVDIRNYIIRKIENRIFEDKKKKNY